MEINFTPFPVLKTERLILRALEHRDAEANFLLRSNEEVNKYLEGFRHQTILQTRTFIEKIRNGIEQNEWIYWVISIKDGAPFIGTICLWNFSKETERAETGYALHPGFQGKGYMQEALTAVLDYGFNSLKLKIMEAYTHPENERSVNLLLKNNFQLDNVRKPMEGGMEHCFVLHFETT